MPGDNARAVVPIMYQEAICIRNQQTRPMTPEKVYIPTAEEIGLGTQEESVTQIRFFDATIVTPDDLRFKISEDVPGLTEHEDPFKQLEIYSKPPESRHSDDYEKPSTSSAMPPCKKMPSLMSYEEMQDILKVSPNLPDKIFPSSSSDDSEKPSTSSAKPPYETIYSLITDEEMEKYELPRVSPNLPDKIFKTPSPNYCEKPSTPSSMSPNDDIEEIPKTPNVTGPLPSMLSTSPSPNYCEKPSTSSAMSPNDEIEEIPKTPNVTGSLPSTLSVTEPFDVLEQPSTVYEVPLHNAIPDQDEIGAFEQSENSASKTASPSLPELDELIELDHNVLQIIQEQHEVEWTCNDKVPGYNAEQERGNNVQSSNVDQRCSSENVQRPARGRKRAYTEDNSNIVAVKTNSNQKKRSTDEAKRRYNNDAQPGCSYKVTKKSQPKNDDKKQNEIIKYLTRFQEKIKKENNDSDSNEDDKENKTFDSFNYWFEIQEINGNEYNRNFNFNPIRVKKEFNMMNLELRYIQEKIKNIDLAISTDRITGKYGNVLSSYLKMLEKTEMNISEFFRKDCRKWRWKKKDRQ